LIAAVSLFAVALLPACNRDAPPSSLFNAGGYHVRGEKVYYLRSFPGDAFEIDGADPASFHAFDQTYARDKATVYVDGRALPGADAGTFEPTQTVRSRCRASGARCRCSCPRRRRTP
jgi:hypothetical protein